MKGKGKGKSGYSAKIEKRLAELYITPANVLRSRFYAPNIEEEFEMVDAAGRSLGNGVIHALRYNPAGQICDLCGHNPINRIFGVKCVQSGKVIEVGSECIQNWVGADLASAMAKLLDQKKNAIVYDEKYVDEIAAFTAIVNDPNEIKTRQVYDYKTHGYINQTYDSWDKRNAQRLLDRIKNGDPNPILDSDKRFVASALQRIGKAFKVNEKHANLLKGLQARYDNAKKFNDALRAMDWDARTALQMPYLLTSRVSNFCHCFEVASKEMQSVGSISQKFGKLLRDVDANAEYFVKAGLSADLFKKVVK